MRRAAVVGVATALLVIQASAAWAWGAKLVPQDPPPLAGETVTIGVVADLGGKLGRDPDGWSRPTARPTCGACPTTW